MVWISGSDCGAQCTTTILESGLISSLVNEQERGSSSMREETLCSMEQQDSWYLLLVIWLMGQLNSAADAECTLRKRKENLLSAHCSWVRPRSDHVPTMKKNTRFVWDQAKTTLCGGSCYTRVWLLCSDLLEWAVPNKPESDSSCLNQAGLKMPFVCSLSLTNSKIWYDQCFSWEHVFLNRRI